MDRVVTLASGFLLCASVAFAQVGSSVVRGGEATFEGLGDLDGPEFASGAEATSSDGSVVVGAASAEEGFVAFRWENGEMVGLGSLPGGVVESFAQGVSADGSVAVGWSSSENGTEAFRWEDGEMVGLGVLSDELLFLSEARGVSADGSVVVGRSSSEKGIESFRWENEEIEGLGDLEGGSFLSTGNAVSADGSVVVGSSSSENGDEAFRWTEESGMVGLGDLPGGDFSSPAGAVSADGSVIVGGSHSANGTEAFRWEDGEMEGLGSLSGGDFFSWAAGVSMDGSVVVGYSISDIGQEAFIWTEDRGMRSLKEVLEEDYDLDLTGWLLLEARDISDDGNVIVGYGFNPDGDVEAWRAAGLMPVADEATPEEIATGLSHPTPNPARGTTTLMLAVARGQKVAVEVFDIMGRRLETLYEGVLAGGMSERLTLDASALPAGVYVIRATGKDFAGSRRVTVIR